MISSMLIVCVNYNSYHALYKYLHSIDLAASYSDNNIVVCVADNSSFKEPIEIDCKNIKLQIYKMDNLGYLNTALSVLQSVDNLDLYDFITISNVDISMDLDFFKILNSIQINDSIMWIAPSIWSKKELRDYNPKVTSRYSLHTLKKLILMYRIPVLYWIYTNTLYKRKRKSESDERKIIYAGHGSFMMLKNAFFRQYADLSYPLFLYGEELFIAELIKKNNGEVEYIPTLKIYDDSHVSTAQLTNKQYFDYNYKALNYIRKTFYCHE